MGTRIEKKAENKKEKGNIHHSPCPKLKTWVYTFLPPSLVRECQLYFLSLAQMQQRPVHPCFIVVDKKFPLVHQQPEENKALQGLLPPPIPERYLWNKGTQCLFKVEHRRLTKPFQVSLSGIHPFSDLCVSICPLRHEPWLVLQWVHVSGRPDPK